jgi:hypothetical protein
MYALFRHLAATGQFERSASSRIPSRALRRPPLRATRLLFRRSRLHDAAMRSCSTRRAEMSQFTAADGEFRARYYIINIEPR